MKPIGEKRKVEARNANGGFGVAYHQDYEIEAEDVGRIREHYLGMNHAVRRFGLQHVGKTIIVMTDNAGWTCWTFKDIPA